MVFDLPGYIPHPHALPEPLAKLEAEDKITAAQLDAKPLFEGQSQSHQATLNTPILPIEFSEYAKQRLRKISKLADQMISYVDSFSPNKKSIPKQVNPAIKNKLMAISNHLKMAKKDLENIQKLEKGSLGKKIDVQVLKLNELGEKISQIWESQAKSAAALAHASLKREEESKRDSMAALFSEIEQGRTTKQTYTRLGLDGCRKLFKKLSLSNVLDSNEKLLILYADIKAKSSELFKSIKGSDRRFCNSDADYTIQLIFHRIENDFPLLWLNQIEMDALTSEHLNALGDKFLLSLFKQLINHVIKYEDGSLAYRVREACSKLHTLERGKFLSDLDKAMKEMDKIESSIPKAEGKPNINRFKQQINDFLEKLHQTAGVEEELYRLLERDSFVNTEFSDLLSTPEVNQALDRYIQAADTRTKDRIIVKLAQYEFISKTAVSHVEYVAIFAQALRKLLQQANLIRQRDAKSNDSRSLAPTASLSLGLERASDTTLESIAQEYRTILNTLNVAYPTLLTSPSINGQIRNASWLVSQASIEHDVKVQASQKPDAQRMTEEDELFIEQTISKYVYEGDPLKKLVELAYLQSSLLEPIDVIGITDVWTDGSGDFFYLLKAIQELRAGLPLDSRVRLIIRHLNPLPPVNFENYNVRGNEILFIDCKIASDVAASNLAIAEATGKEQLSKIYQTSSKNEGYLNKCKEIIAFAKRSNLRITIMPIRDLIILNRQLREIPSIAVIENPQDLTYDPHMQGLLHLGLEGEGTGMMGLDPKDIGMFAPTIKVAEEFDDPGLKNLFKASKPYFCYQKFEPGLFLNFVINNNKDSKESISVIFAGDEALVRKQNLDFSSFSSVNLAKFKDGAIVAGNVVEIYSNPFNSKVKTLTLINPFPMSNNDFQKCTKDSQAIVGCTVGMSFPETLALEKIPFFEVRIFKIPFWKSFQRLAEYYNKRNVAKFTKSILSNTVPTGIIESNLKAEMLYLYEKIKKFHNIGNSFQARGKRAVLLKKFPELKQIEKDLKSKLIKGEISVQEFVKRLKQAI